MENKMQTILNILEDISNTFAATDGFGTTADLRELKDILKSISFVDRKSLMVATRKILKVIESNIQKIKDILEKYSAAK
jgi:hypothetical protein